MGPQRFGGLLEGEERVYDGLDDIIRQVCGFDPYHSRSDIRRDVISVIAWDYRGRVEGLHVDGRNVRLEVAPRGKVGWRAVGLASTTNGNVPFKVDAPGSNIVDVRADIYGVQLVLRHGDEEIDERRAYRAGTMAVEAGPQQNAGAHPSASDVPPAGRPVSAATPAGFSFLHDSKLRGIVTRDLAELDTALTKEMHKAALLLCGSILEGVLLDVLRRNAGLAASLFDKGRWPNDVSLQQLIRVASEVQVQASDGTVAALIGHTVAKMGGIVTEHRDLVHPQAEVRTGIRVDSPTVELMVALLKNVVRDLSEAADAGLLDAYANGHVP